ncbi:chemotaxis-specific protein-glutamate methyltransferase CheB [Silvanigrella sp.]|jgi:chemotaxis response regulator CheB/chemotaxis methyl-accepting protein methylase|uniref:chemotaxis-specific protein-glutamate methyltransferase CheB n=1 Tax=Silvanigrella sp. TaxID=2024976 RepID=UPI0037CCAAA0
MNSEWYSLIQKICHIAHEETGNQLNEKNFTMVESRLNKRFTTLGITTPSDYLKHLNANFDTEKKAIISLLTTHHSYFFREYFHFEDIEKKYLNQIINDKRNKTIRIWSSASSQGQEAYSLSMFFHKLKKENKIKDFDYKIIGTDVDHESVKYAQNGVYFYKDISQVPMSYVHGNWVRGLASIRDFVKPKKHIKDPVSFEEANLLKLSNKFINDKFDIIFCRNVLIYFNQQQVSEIINSLLSRLEPNGLLVLGISESILGLNLPVKLLSNSIYCHKDYSPKEKVTFEEIKPIEKSLINVLCVDDSPTILVLLKKVLTKDKGFQVVSTAANTREAREKLKTNNVDIITLDIHMPEETGIEYLKADFHKEKHPPVLIVSSIERDGTTIAKEALSLGASDYVEKPDLKNIEESSEEICFKLETIYNDSKKIKPISKNEVTSNYSNNINNEIIKVLIVDDSKTIRMQLKNILSKNKQIQVVGEVEDPRTLEDQIKILKPDVITLDINMPFLSGIDILKLILPKYKIPTIVVSALNMEEGSLVMEALELGAFDFFQKPDFRQLEEESKVLIDKIIHSKNAKIPFFKAPIVKSRVDQNTMDGNYLIAIGSSTGGTEALKHILEELPSQIPPILIVQHIPEVFSKALADRLNKLCPFEVREAKNGDIVEKNNVYIAPGNKHMIVKKNNQNLQIEITETSTINGHRPSVDVLFNSVAQLKLKKTIGVILTGMGSDGARGLKQLKDSGSKTIAQNEATCVVFGMPKEAIKLNAADFIEPIDNISNKLIHMTRS